MHDLDRTLQEFETGIDALESGEFEYGDGMLGEVEEMEYAVSLLEISDDQELEQFFGSLVKAAGTFMGSPAGKALVGVLKNAAGRALPTLGGAIGNAIGGSTGRRFGQQAGRWAKGQLGWEMEGAEDQELEVAQGLVRVATAAAQQLAQAPTGGSPAAAAKRAAVTAAQQVAPQLTRLLASTQGSSSGGGRGGGRSGTWIRKGNRIILLGV